MRSAYSDLRIDRQRRRYLFNNQLFRLANEILDSVEVTELIEKLLGEEYDKLLPSLPMATTATTTEPFAPDRCESRASTNSWKSTPSPSPPSVTDAAASSTS